MNHGSSSSTPSSAQKPARRHSPFSCCLACPYSFVVCHAKHEQLIYPAVASQQNARAFSFPTSLLPGGDQSGWTFAHGRKECDRLRPLYRESVGQCPADQPAPRPSGLSSWSATVQQGSWVSHSGSASTSERSGIQPGLCGWIAVRRAPGANLAGVELFTSLSPCPRPV